MVAVTGTVITHTGKLLLQVNWLRGMKPLCTHGHGQHQPGQDCDPHWAEALQAGTPTLGRGGQEEGQAGADSNTPAPFTASILMTLCP